MWRVPGEDRRGTSTRVARQRAGAAATMRGTAGRMAVEWRLAPGGRRRGTARRRGTGRAARVPRAGPGRGGRAGRTGGVGCGTPGG